MRPVKDHERTLLSDAMNRFERGLLDRLLREMRAEIWTDDARRPQPVYALASRLAQDLAQADTEIHPLSAGLFLGELDKREVHYSLEGAYEIGRRTRSGQVVVTDKAAQLFLYGREVLAGSVLRFDSGARRGRVAFVANARGEVLGLAEVLQNLPGHGPVLRPLADRGWYLREGG